MQKKDNVKKSKVSIVVPIYNVEKYLPKCLDSLVKQTFKDIEIWAISDGSPDNSVSIVKKYAKKDDRIKCIEKENGGYGSVLEYAIKNITTDYFLICDPDDWLREDAIEILYEAASKYNLDLVRGAYYNVYSNDGEEEYKDGYTYPNVFKPMANVVYTRDIDQFWFMSESPHSKLYRTELAKKIQFPHNVSYTDGVLYKLFIPRAKRIMYIDQALSYYLVDREGNTVTDVKPKIADDHYAVFRAFVDQYKNYKKQSKYFYYRVFLHYIYINLEVSKIKDRKDFEAKREIVYKMLKECVQNRNKIIPFLKYETPKKRIACRLLLNPLTSRVTFIYFSNKFYNRNHR